MKLKKRVQNLGEVDERYHNLYRQAEDGNGYELVVDVEDDSSGKGGQSGKSAEELEQELERYQAKHQEAERHRKEAERKAEELNSKVEEMDKKVKELEQGKDDHSRQKGDVDALDKSWQEKVEKLQQQHEQEKERLQGSLKTMLVDNVADQLANEISTSPELIRPHVKDRLQADLDGDEPKTKVVDKDGNPSALSLDELKNELFSSESFAPIIKGSEASGSGAKGGQGGGGAADKRFDEYSSQELKELHESDPEKYEQLRTQYYGTGE